MPDEHVREVRQRDRAFHVAIGEHRQEAPRGQFAGDQPVLIYARVIVIVDEIEAGRLPKYQPNRQQQQTANGQQGDAVGGRRPAARQTGVSAAVATHGTRSIVRPLGPFMARIAG